MQFDIVRLSDNRVIFQGVPPYDEMQYDLGDVKIVFWVCGYFMDLKGREWLRNWIAKAGIVGVWDIIREIDESEGEYSISFLCFCDCQENYKKYKFIYGSGLIIRVSNEIPVILEFRVDLGIPIYALGTFYSEEYLRHHHYPVPNAEYAGLLMLAALCCLISHCTCQFLPLFFTLPIPKRRRAR